MPDNTREEQKKEENYIKNMFLVLKCLKLHVNIYLMISILSLLCFSLIN